MISAIRNLGSTGLAVTKVWAEGLCALLALLALAAKLAMGGGLRRKLGAALREMRVQRQVLAVLRAFAPNLPLKRRLVRAYDNTGTVIVTRRNDCLEVLRRDEDFEVVYESRMRQLTDGRNFFLGMQPGWDYTRDVSAMRMAARQSDIAEIILPRARDLSRRIVAESGGRLDLPADLSRQVPWDMTRHYFGTGGPDAASMQDWTTTLFWYLFEDLPADPDLARRALQAAAAMRDYLDSAIATRKASPTGKADILNRCLALQAAGAAGMDDPGIRNNLLGLLIGAIPTISKACCLAMDELLNRPEALHIAHRAALADDDALLARCLWEALRFNPHNPVIYRRATRDTTIAANTLREVRVAKGQMVFASTLSAMFDRHGVTAPQEFRTDRDFGTYIIWGYGMHHCFGAAINTALVPAILKPVLAQPNLRRAPGPAGQINTGQTPHPRHFHLEFDN